MIKPVNYEPSQHFGDNPTSVLSPDHWLIQRFGNYQPDGHTGIDYPCPAGTPVKAVTSGTVLHVGWFGGSYADNPYWIAPGFAGYCYVVDHGDFVGIYAHCLDGGSRVKVGQRVTEGQILGPSGNTGGSTGDHLHFETLPNGWIVNSRMYGRVNPATILARITPQSTPPAPKEDTLSAAEVKEIKDHINAVLIGGYSWDGKKHPGIGMVVEENQKRISAIPAKVAAAVWGAVVKRAAGNVTALQELADTKTKVLGIEPAIARIEENTDPAALADLIPDALAQQVIDALAARLNK